MARFNPAQQPCVELEYMDQSELEEFISETGKEMALSSQEVEQLHLRRRRLSVEQAQQNDSSLRARVHAGEEQKAPLKLMILGDEQYSDKIRYGRDLYAS